MQKSNGNIAELTTTIEKLHTNCKEIYNLCVNNQEHLTEISKVSELLADNNEYIQIIKSYKEMENNDLYNSIMNEKADIITETLELSKNINEIFKTQKDVKADKIKNINQKKNLLIYK